MTKDPNEKKDKPVEDAVEVKKFHRAKLLMATQGPHSQASINHHYLVRAY